VKATDDAASGEKSLCLSLQNIRQVNSSDFLLLSFFFDWLHCLRALRTLPAHAFAHCTAHAYACTAILAYLKWTLDQGVRQLRGQNA
jgi:hypothetical protein